MALESFKIYNDTEKILLLKAKKFYLEKSFFFKIATICLTTLEREIYFDALCSHKSYWSINLLALVAIETVLYFFPSWLHVLESEKQ